jgi:LPXTG-site transpeptidase (sortase) family protein
MKRASLFLFIVILLFTSGCSGKKENDKENVSFDKPSSHSQVKKIEQKKKASEEVKFTPEEYRKKVFLLAKEHGIDVDSILKENEESTVALTGIIPNRLQIPSIGLDVPVVEVGVLENGQMGVPKNYHQAGVFVPWTKPGEIGSSVIAGHLDHKTGPAVFFNLKRLTPSDSVVVLDAKGNKREFVVSSIERFKTEEAPLERIFQSDDGAHLNLVTCTGKFNRKTRQHPKRLVVFTTLKENVG